jgi:hypothetical protein
VAFGCAPAFANICRSIEAELAAIARGPGARERQIAARAAWEAQRLRAHMSAIGCDRQPFLFLGPQPPAECRAYRAQLGHLHAQAQTAYPADSARRRQLEAMLVTNDCRAAPRSRPLTAGIFDQDERRPGGLDSIEIDPGPAETRLRAPAGKPVCVRLCDGFFFPLNMRGPEARDAGDDACRALCPGAETKTFYMQGDIEEARSVDGELYADLDNALRYRKRYDPSCFCRRPDERNGGQSLILNPDGTPAPPFDVVNPLPDPAPVEDPVPLRGTAPAPNSNATLFGREPRAVPAPPPAPEIEGLITMDQGATREVVGPDGVKRTIRVIGPTSSPAPGAGAAGAAPGRARPP